MQRPTCATIVRLARFHVWESAQCMGQRGCMPAEGRPWRVRRLSTSIGRIPIRVGQPPTFIARDPQPAPRRGRREWPAAMAATESMDEMDESPLPVPVDAESLREAFGDRKPPDITRKITACVACRKQKVPPAVQTPLGAWSRRLTHPRSNVTCEIHGRRVRDARDEACHAR